MFRTLVKALALAAAATTLCASAHAATLTLTVTNIKKPVGVIRLCLFSEKTSLPDVYPDCAAGRPVKELDINVSGQTASASISDLPDGVYAISLFHDENADGKMTMKSMMGITTPIPREGIGISNNPLLLGKPEFGEARFIVKGDTAVSIEMKYF